MGVYQLLAPVFAGFPPGGMNPEELLPLPGLSPR